MSADDELESLLGSYFATAAGQRDGAFGRLAKGLKAAVLDKRHDEAASALARALTPGLDYTSAQVFCRIQRALAAERKPALKTRLAILGSVTTTQLTPLIEMFLYAAGVDAEIYEAPYGLFRHEILDPGSKLHAFAPQTVLLATTWRDLAHCPPAASDRAQVSQALEAEWADWSALWQALQGKQGCQVIQSNFVPPSWRLLGNYEMKHPASLGRYISLFNRELHDRAPAFVTVHDVEHLAALNGRRSWDDPRFFLHAKMPCNPEHLVEYAHSIASLVCAHLGLSRKCLVLDLDNTLWGGVIGDDGVGGIRLGQGDAEGEAFLAFQRYVNGLRQRGVILAVCSKNEEKAAREPFEQHSEMVLRMGDISCFVANWTDKAANLKHIARQLNIGLNSLVFVDDNPAERALVRRLAPEVAVPELPEDPALYIDALERHSYFQVLTLGQEDLQRTALYQANAARQELESSADSIDSFLQSLQMVARVGPLEAATLERSAQLIGRSNQFNLTTRRHGAAALQAFMQDPDWVTLTVSLADRFGDNGLISVVLAHVQGQALEIDTWLMSCRVLKRGVEQLLRNELCECARRRGLALVRGEYIPSAKNAMVREHYAQLGFTLCSSQEDGRTVWELPLTQDLSPLTHFISKGP